MIRFVVCYVFGNAVCTNYSLMSRFYENEITTQSARTRLDSYFKFDAAHAAWNVVLGECVADGEPTLEREYLPPLLDAEVCFTYPFDVIANIYHAI